MDGEATTAWYRVNCFYMLFYRMYRVINATEITNRIEENEYTP